MAMNSEVFCPNAMIMAPSHPFGHLLIEQLNFNLRFFKQADLSWMERPSRGISVCCNCWCDRNGMDIALASAKRKEELSRARLLPFQAPFALNHQEHNEWLSSDDRPKELGDRWSIWRLKRIGLYGKPRQTFSI